VRTRDDSVGDDDDGRQQYVGYHRERRESEPRRAHQTDTRHREAKIPVGPRDVGLGVEVQIHVELFGGVR